MALRLLSRPFRICSEETLGMSPQMFDKASSNFGKIPVPPVMNVQLDLMMSSIVIHPLHQAILAQLQNLIHANKTSSWFTIYLCSFILLHSCSIFTAFENGYAKKHGAKVPADFMLAFQMHNADVSSFSPVTCDQIMWKKTIMRLESCLHISTTSVKGPTHLHWIGLRQTTLR